MRCCLVLLLCVLCDLLAAHARLGVGGGSARLVQPEVMPGVPSAPETRSRATANVMAAQKAEDEVYITDAQLRTAAAMEGASKAQLVVTHKEIETESAAKVGELGTERATLYRQEADAVASNTRKLIEGIPLAVRKAAKQAVSDVMAAAYGTMNAEVQRVLDSLQDEDKDNYRKAAEYAHKAVLPFQLEKLRHSQTMYSYVLQARELAMAVNQLRAKALSTAQQAGILQTRGNVVTAQRLQMQAHILLDKASSLEEQAKAFNRKASSIQQQLPSYDVAISSGTEYGVYKADPPPRTRELPLPPPPLTLPPPSNVLAAPAPAPGAASPA